MEFVVSVYATVRLTGLLNRAELLDRVTQTAVVACIQTGNHDLGELGVPGTALIAGTIASHHSGPDVVGEPRNYPAGIGNVG